MSGPNDVTGLLQLMASHQKLDRDRAASDLIQALRNLNPEEFDRFSEYLLTQTPTNESKWEEHHALLSALKIAVSSAWSTDDLLVFALNSSISRLEHPEYRVRITAGEALGSLCKRSGSQIYLKVKSMIVEGIRTNLQRGEVVDEKLSAKLSRQSSDESEPELVLGSSPRTEALMYDEIQANVSAREKIFHDTAGWKNLETWMKCLQCVVEGCGRSFNEHIDQSLLDLIFTSLTHTNRFVRETGFQTCSTLVACNTSATDSDTAPFSDSENSIYKFGQQFAEYLSKGLADNWSQVRLAASQATRSFLLALKPEARTEYYSLLLPRMCLNRYYVAEGVRIYSQETWRRITDNNGKQLVEQYIQPTVEFYIRQSEAENHAVREAACSCISELGSKLNPDVVRPHVSSLIQSLRVCFLDDSWPVRDAACIASGHFIECFPEECRPYFESIYPLFYENLEDNIPSVRSGAAVALKNIVKTYGADLTVDMLNRIESAFKDISQQAETAEKYAGLESGPATYSVVKRARDNDDELHTNKTMYSCGSLAPKMGRGKDTGGCMHSTFRRPCEPWERAEGCVHLLVEISKISQTHEKIGQLLPILSSAATYKHYTQHVVFHETICKRLVELARNIGKRYFKPHMEPFFDHIFYSLTCDNALTSAAASQCLNNLSSYLGPNILRGRLEAINHSWIDLLNQHVGQPPFP